MDSKCRLSAKPDEQIAATSCLIFLGPLTRTPTLDPAHSDIIPAGEKNEIYFSYLKGLETENNLQLGMLLMGFWEMKKREEGEDSHNAVWGQNSVGSFTIVHLGCLDKRLVWKGFQLSICIVKP